MTRLQRYTFSRAAARRSVPPPAPASGPAMQVRAEAWVFGARLRAVNQAQGAKDLRARPTRRNEKYSLLKTVVLS